MKEKRINSGYVLPETIYRTFDKYCEMHFKAKSHVITDLITNFLIQEGYLPENYKTGGMQNLVNE